MGLLAIIPARGGSKGIPGKNLLPIAGKPLIQYAIEAAKNSKFIKLIVVTSDSDEILEFAKIFGVGTLKRPDCLATDTAKSDGVILHAIEELQEKNQFEDVVLLQPTSPLRRTSDIDAAWETYARERPAMLMSVYQPEIHLQKAMYRNSEGLLEPLLGREAPFTPRQSLPEVFLPNGAIYIFTKEGFMKNRCLPRTKIYPYEMGLEESIDIDNLADVKIAESILMAP